MDSQSQISGLSTKSRSGKNRNKKGVTFVLSERSLRDPNAYDSEAPTNILLRKGDRDESLQEKKEYELSYRKYLGIEYEDNHDYEKYLVDNPDEDGEDVLNNRDFLTKDEIYGNFIGDSIDAQAVDPEVAFMLEDDCDNEDIATMTLQTNEDGKIFDFEETLEKCEEFDDDFVKELNAVGSDDEISDESQIPKSTSKMSYAMQQFLGDAHSAAQPKSILNQIPEDAEMDNFSENEIDFDQDDKKSRFTNYSMTSSVMRRKAGLARIDNDFEEFYSNFDENDIGDLENQVEEIQNEFVSEDMDETTYHLLMNTHFKQVQKESMLDFEETGLGMRNDETLTEQEKNKIKQVSIQTAEIFENENEDELKNGKTHGDLIDEFLNKDYKPKAEFDCESILTTKSNLYNRPKEIDESNYYIKRNKIKINKKGFPVDGRSGGFKKLMKSEKQEREGKVRQGSDSGEETDDYWFWGDIHIIHVTYLFLLYSLHVEFETAALSFLM